MKNLGLQESWVTRVGSIPWAEPRGFSLSTDPSLQIQQKSTSSLFFPKRKTSINGEERETDVFLSPPHSGNCIEGRGKTRRKNRKKERNSREFIEKREPWNANKKGIRRNRAWKLGFYGNEGKKRRRRRKSVGGFNPENSNQLYTPAESFIFHIYDFLIAPTEFGLAKRILLSDLINHIN